LAKLANHHPQCSTWMGTTGLKTLNGDYEHKGVGRKISRGRGPTQKTRPKNSTIKPPSALSVSCMKIQGATAPRPCTNIKYFIIFICRLQHHADRCFKFTVFTVMTDCASMVFIRLIPQSVLFFRAQLVAKTDLMINMVSMVFCFNTLPGLVQMKKNSRRMHFQ